MTTFRRDGSQGNVGTYRITRGYSIKGKRILSYYQKLTLDRQTTSCCCVAVPVLCLLLLCFYLFIAALLDTGHCLLSPVYVSTDSIYQYKIFNIKDKISNRFLEYFGTNDKRSKKPLVFAE